MKILVTGSAGRIGKVVKALLESHGHTVRPFDKEQGDLRDIEAVTAAVEGMDAVAHLGAIPWAVPGKDYEVMSVNVQGTTNVLLACVQHGVKRVVAYSSVNAFGSFGMGREVVHLPGGDDYPHGSFNIYQLSKHLNEEMCAYYAQHYGMTILCPRPVFVSSAEHYPKWHESTEDGHMVDLCSYVDITDVAEATRLALTNENLSGFHAFLLAADDTTSVHPTADIIARRLASVPWRVSQEEWLAKNPHRGLIDCRIAKELLGWQPKVSWRTV
ncbi:NAD(P)-dependent oxidoreductase [Armatimonas sp.]|uniref:NAD-dependent epimerase/dehydratase family protein n=1 Tax=Armatimonas sp. TaxID=1872638 RepID=UPI00286B9165|nr:NAD(P)-dependent oxidoreductase [Armatimonas sp.]